MELIELLNGPTSVVLGYEGRAMPRVLHLGAPIAGFDLNSIGRPIPHASLNDAPPLGLVAEHAAGFEGRPGLLGMRSDGSSWAPLFELTDIKAEPTKATFRAVDPVAQLELLLDVQATPVGTVEIACSLTNIDSADLAFHLLRLSPSVPLPADTSEFLSFTGRWCREFQPERHDLQGTFVVENRHGRTSHERLPAVIAGSAGFGEHQGNVLGVHLAWSGNYELAVERLVDEYRHVQAGELLWPGEIILEPGERYDAPTVIVAWSESGLEALSRQFQAHIRAGLNINGHRKVLLNTWEAVYFDHNLDKLSALAETAAGVGVERFVLDDGWFGSRRDSTSGLGDWHVSEDVWPDGLGPLIDAVHSHGMDFGLWVEPEMVNPDSELFRAHREWALATDGYEPLLARNQLVLDFGRPEVRDHIVGALSALLERYDIAYLKWDMNRRMVQGSGGIGDSPRVRAGTHRHVRGLYEVLSRIEAAHPEVEIESCASGGARVDAGILSLTHRVWASDCNDALERQHIQRGFSMLFPPEIMGSHIGPGTAHTTGRSQPLGFRIATAIFGHLGIEWNLLEATAEERQLLATAIALHKQLRPLLHSGEVLRCDSIDPAWLTHGVVNAEKSHALLALVALAPSRSSVPRPVRIPGLDPDTGYRIKVHSELESYRLFGERGPVDPTNVAWMHRETVLSGSQLARLGLQQPVVHPESAVIVELTAV